MPKGEYLGIYFGFVVVVMGNSLINYVMYFLDELRHVITLTYKDFRYL